MAATYQGASPNARFLAGQVDSASHEVRRFGTRFSASLLSHIAGFFVIFLAMTYLPEPTPANFEIVNPSEIVWIAQEGPGGGGGGGGNEMPEPPRQAELPGEEKITVPVEKKPDIRPDPPKETPKPEQEMNIPALTMARGMEEIPGEISNLPAPPSPSQGTGSGGGAGTGEGTGMGPGRGSGLGPGEGGGTGGGVYRPGNGVMPPRLIREVKPNYTADAMRAKIQGVVTLEAVVLTDGSVGNVHVTRSLDPTFGLDEEAIRTVKQWRFAPGTRFGQPVPVLVEIEMTFTLR